MKQGEADGLLELWIALDHHVGTRPEAVEVTPLSRQETFPPDQACGFQRRGDLVAQRWDRAVLRPAIGNELDDAQLLALLDQVRERYTGGIGQRLRPDVGAWRSDDDVVHRRRHA